MTILKSPKSDKTSHAPSIPMHHTYITTEAMTTAHVKVHLCL